MVLFYLLDSGPSPILYYTLKYVRKILYIYYKHRLIALYINHIVDSCSTQKALSFIFLVKKYYYIWLLRRLYLLCFQLKSTVTSGCAAKLKNIRPNYQAGAISIRSCCQQDPILLILFFAYLIFFFHTINRKKINETFFILYKSWVMIKKKLFEVELNFLIKSCLFWHFKNALKIFYFFLFFFNSN